VIHALNVPNAQSNISVYLSSSLNTFEEFVDILQGASCP
jgi:hypothetical protein